jgi:DNA-binding response OmpR family regulator
MHLVLLAENSSEDVLLFQYWMRKANIQMVVLALETAGSVSDYMRGRGEYSDRSFFPLPALIFVSSQLPDSSSLPLVGWLARTLPSAKIPIVVLTKGSETMCTGARRSGALGCFSKPFQAQQWEQLGCLLTSRNVMPRVGHRS